MARGRAGSRSNGRRRARQGRRFVGGVETNAHILVGQHFGVGQHERRDTAQGILNNAMSCWAMSPRNLYCDYDCESIKTSIRDGIYIALSVFSER